MYTISCYLFRRVKYYTRLRIDKLTTVVAIEYVPNDTHTFRGLFFGADLKNINQNQNPIRVNMKSNSNVGGIFGLTVHCPIYTNLNISTYYVFEGNIFLKRVYISCKVLKELRLGTQFSLNRWKIEKIRGKCR